MFLAWSSKVAPEQGAVHGVLFAKDAPEALTSHQIDSGPFTVVGQHIATASAREERFHMVYTLSGSETGLVHRTLNAGDGALGAPLTIPWGAAPGPVSLAEIPGQGLVATAFDSARMAQVVLQNDGDVWNETAQLSGSFDAGSYGLGQSSVFVGEDLRLHVAQLRTIGRNRAHPRYVRHDGTAWTQVRTLDDPEAAELTGYQLSLAVTRSGRRALAYFVLSRSGRAELRLATWKKDQLPLIEVLAEMPAPVSSADVDVAVAEDRHGRIHLAVACPKAGNTEITYWREDPLRPSKWLRDVVSPDAGAAGPALVDLVVDSAGDPHIGYYDSRSGSIQYGASVVP